MRSLEDFHPYQEQAVEKMLANPLGALFLDVGLGKTAVALTVINELTDRLDVRGCLVLAPKRVCEATWQQEAERWGHTQHLRFSVVMGTPKQRSEALKADADIYLMNYENLKWLIGKFFGLKNKREVEFLNGARLPFNMIVMDELSMVANPQSIRNQAIQVMSKMGCDYRMGLTATPATNGLFKLFGEFKAIDGGVHLGKTKGIFEGRYFYLGHNGKLLPRVNAKHKIFEEVKPITYAAGAKDHLPMDKPIIENRIVHLPADAREIYDKMESQFYADLPHGEELKATNTAAMMNKCLQIANGTAYLHPDDPDYTTVHDEKLDELEEIVESLQGNPLLVCYQFKMDQWRIKARFGSRCADVKDFKKMPACVAEWEAGRIPILTGHPASMGHGLNLQHGGHHLAWYGLTWNLEHYEQAIGRIWRQGQKHPVVVHRIVAADTFDSVVSDRLAGKAQTQEEFLNLLRAHALARASSTN